MPIRNPLKWSFLILSLSLIPFALNYEISFPFVNNNFQKVEPLEDIPLTFKSMCDRVNDSLALVELYDSTNGANWTNTWDLTTPIDNWFGVDLNEEGCVMCLDMDGFSNCSFSGAGNNLVGTLPDLNLPHLVTLYLGKNQLSGGIPDFSNLPALERMEINENHLSGDIPDFTSLPNLTVLNLSNNQLSGVIPDFSFLISLVSLNFTGNQLEGVIPDFTSLSNLHTLNLAGNQLEGSIPNFSNLTNLTRLILGGNDLNETIPNFSNLPNLRDLNFSGNDLMGTIPDFANLINLQYLQLSNNRLEGIPNLANLPELELLILNNNNLKEIIPDYSNNLPELRVIELRDNLLTFEDVVPNFNANKELVESNTVGSGEGSSPGYYTYAPQDSIFTDTTFFTNVGDNLSIDLLIDEAVDSNEYYWFKNGIAWDTIYGNNNLDFMDLELTDAGIYQVQIKNLGVPNLTLKSRSITVTVNPFTGPCIVTNTNDSGIGSLRAAVNCANTNPGPDTVIFDIASPPPYNIQLTSAQLNVIDAGTVVDARTQNGWEAWNLAVIAGGSLIDSTAFFVQGNNTELYGLKLQGFSRNGVTVEDVSGFTIADCESTGNNNYGISLQNVNTIQVERNKVHHNGGNGIWIDGCNTFTLLLNEVSQNGVNGIVLDGSDGGVVEKNISEMNGMNGGTQSSGIIIFNSNDNIIKSNSFSGSPMEGGVLIFNGSQNNLIEDNFISQNFYGIWIGGEGSPSNTITKNTILDSQSTGIRITEVNGTGADSDNNEITENIISYSGGAAVKIEGGQSNYIVQNRMEDNNGIGIDLVFDGNQAVDPPIICGLSSNRLEGRVGVSSTLHLYVADQDDPCQGFQYIGTTPAIPGENWSFNRPFSPDSIYAVTATDQFNNTSEFACSGPYPDLIPFTDTTVCGAEIINLDAGPGYIGYEWSTGETSRMIFVNEPNDYAVTATSSEGCIYTDMVTVMEESDIPISVVDTSINISANEWQCMALFDPLELSGDTLDWVDVLLEEPAFGNLIHNGLGQYCYKAGIGLSGTTSFVYELCYQICDVCITATVMIDVEAGDLQQDFIITPNGDGLNDEFTLEILQDFLDSHFMVFNRWGSKVYEEMAYQGGWGGVTETGQELPDGTYFYILELDLGEGLVLKGSITLLR